MGLGESGGARDIREEHAVTKRRKHEGWIEEPVDEVVMEGKLGTPVNHEEEGVFGFLGVEVRRCEKPGMDGIGGCRGCERNFGYLRAIESFRGGRCEGEGVIVLGRGGKDGENAWIKHIRAGEKETGVRRRKGMDIFDSSFLHQSHWNVW